MKKQTLPIFLTEKDIMDIERKFYYDLESWYIRNSNKYGYTDIILNNRRGYSGRTASVFVGMSRYRDWIISTNELC